MTDAVDHWHDDLLDRKQYAEFLTTYLERKSVPGESGIVIALDAPWGLGKSFFVRRWAADLAQDGRAVVIFDAWENDSAEAPVVSFMGELRKSLGPLYEKVPKTAALRKGVEKKTREVVTNLRKATLPALAVVGKAVLKKTTGVALDEIMEAFQVEGETDAEAVLDAAAASAPAALEKGLDAFFEKALQGHTERMEAVKAFRQSLEELLDMLHREGLAEGPLYVFIDELDRCRPDYAIRLLEGIKHLFSVKGVAFVVSTNLPQLGSAVGAVYGPAFDGFRYLKRFFDFEYELPQPTRAAFIRSQMVGTALEKLPGASGLDPRGNKANDTAAAFTVVAEAMRLDLRSLQRVIAIADAAATGAPANARFMAIWLFFLSALRHLHPGEFLKVATKTLDERDFSQLARDVMPGPQRMPRIEVDSNGRHTDGETNLPAVLTQIYAITLRSSRDLLDSIGDEDVHAVPYPQLLRQVAADTWNTVSRTPHPMNEHAKLIAAAGHISRSGGQP